MNRKSKGTTLVEVMVSVILISIVMIFIFNLLVDLKSENELTARRSTDSINRASFTRLIQNDFIMESLVGLKPCNKGIFCLDFTFKEKTKRLFVEENRIIYDNELWQLTNGKYLKNNIKFSYYSTSSESNEVLNGTDEKDTHILKIVIPVTTNLSSNRRYDIELTHMSNEELAIDCTEIDDYLNHDKTENGMNIIKATCKK